MRKTLLMTTGLAWLALTGAAGAVTVTLLQGRQDPLYFAPEGGRPEQLHLGWHHLDSREWRRRDTAREARPMNGRLLWGWAMTRTTGTPYMAVEGGGTELATFATAQTSLDIYWGSIDGSVGGNNNSFAITVDGYTLTGADLVALHGANGGGSQTDPLATSWSASAVLAPFTEVTFTSTQNAFEFSIIPPGAFTGGTPEPSTWAMMGLGFAALGYAAFRRNTKARALAI